MLAECLPETPAAMKNGANAAASSIVMTMELTLAVLFSVKLVVRGAGIVVQAVATGVDSRRAVERLAWSLSRRTVLSFSLGWQLG